ncbi:unnamed protein product [Linum trigynum]|uniref:HMA domain-containing protein n=1 Tax=Linum trigynum TaxID=586398 RepID=A0AAV2CQP7_9ROSI
MAGGDQKMQKSYFDVLGLCCSSEVPLIENILKSLEGIKDVSVVVPTRTVIVVHDSLLVSQLQIVKALNSARLEANVRLDGAAGGGSYRKKWPSPYAMGSGVLLLISLLKFVFPPMKWVAVAAVAVGIRPILLKVIASIKNLRHDVNVLVLIAVVSTMALQDYTEAATVVFLFTIADWLESRASHKAKAVMTSLMSIAPQKATIAETGEEVDVDEVKVNTVVAVKAGQAIPIDGMVVDGQCEVDEKSLTGESFPVPKQKDSTVWAGTINLSGYISVKTTALAEDCVVAKMAKLVEEAQNSKSKTQRFIDQCAQYYTPAIILISASVAVIPLALRVHNKDYWFHLALVVLVSACPCSLLLSTPVATFCALTKAATAGLLIKGGDYLETLAKIKVLAFDKTGTITRGDFVVSDFRSLSGDFSMEKLVYWVSSIESKSGHPMAAALVEYGRLISVEPRPENVEEYENIPGEGIHGKIDGREIYVGNKKIAARAGSTTVPAVDDGTKGGMTIGYVYCEGTLIGTFNLSDSCRTGVKEAVNELKSMGIRTAMLTGDSQGAAMHAQQQLENALDEVHAELLPEDKARIIGDFKSKRGPTAMVGDGVNDAPALATADIGISMGISGSALATETGHVILMSNDIRKVPKAIKLARKAHRKVVENVVFSIFTKGSILALAFAGHPLIWAAVLADVGTCVIVILNSMLLLRESHKHTARHSHNHAATHSHKDNHKEKKCCSNRNTEKACHSEKTKCCGPKSQANLHTAKSCEDAKCMKSTTCGGKNATEDLEHCHEVQTNSHHKHGCSGAHEPTPCTGTGHYESEKACHSQKTQCCTSKNQPNLHTTQSCEDAKCMKSTSCGDKNATEDLEQCHEVQTNSHHNHGCSAQKLTPCTGTGHHESEKACHSQKTQCCTSKSQPSLHTAQSSEDSKCAKSDGCGGNDATKGSMHHHGSSSSHEPSLTTCTGHHESEISVEIHGSCRRKDALLEPTHCHTAHCQAVTRDGSDLNESAGDLEKGEATAIHGDCHFIHCDHVDINRNDVPLQKKSTAASNCYSTEVKPSLGCCNSNRNPSESIHCRQLSSCHDAISNTHHCWSSEQREIDSCCKSYMRECCRRNGHFSTGLGGGLSEIVIE